LDLFPYCVGNNQRAQCAPQPANKKHQPAGGGNPIMRIVEPVAVREVFVTTLARVEVGEHYARFTLCSEYPTADGERELRVTARVVMPLDAVSDALLMTAKATALGAIDFPVATAN
jgi:hypothetical protein